jgi:hypothetical protein
MIEPTWLNCLNFMGSEAFESGRLIDYLDCDDVRSTILQHPIPRNSDTKQLRQFLFEAGSLSDIAYKEYVHALPNAFTYIPDKLDSRKLRILFDEEKITFTKENLDELSNLRDLQIIYVAANIDIYLEDPDDFELDEDFFEDILRSEINHEAKLRIVELMDLEELIDFPERSALIGQIIINADIQNLDVNAGIVESLIENSEHIESKISLLNKFHTSLSDEDIREILANLPRPFSTIKTGYNKPNLKNNPENIELVKWLKSRKIILKWKESSSYSNQIDVSLFRKKRD